MLRVPFKNGAEFELIPATERRPKDVCVEFPSVHDARRFLAHLYDNYHDRIKLHRGLEDARLSPNGNNSPEHDLQMLADLLFRGRFLIRAPGGIPRRDDGAAYVARSLLKKTVQEYEPEPLPVETDYITVQLIDEEGEPVADQAYRLELPDGSVKEGVTDGKGMVEVMKTVSGNCTFSYTKLDKDAWEPA